MKSTIITALLALVALTTAAKKQVVWENPSAFMGAYNSEFKITKVELTETETVLMMAEYCLAQQIKAFGEALESQFVNADDLCIRYGSNHSVFDQLAPVFTMDDLRALKRGFCNEPGLRKIISRWYRDKWIEKTDKTHWRKLAAGT